MEVELEHVKVGAREKEESPIDHPRRKERRNKYACACAIIASMISILLGYGI